MRTDIKGTGGDAVPAAGRAGDDTDGRPCKRALGIYGGHPDGAVLHRQGRCGEQMDTGSPGFFRGTVALMYGYVSVVHR